MNFQLLNFQTKFSFPDKLKNEKDASASYNSGSGRTFKLGEKKIFIKQRSPI